MLAAVGSRTFLRAVLGTRTNPEGSPQLASETSKAGPALGPAQKPPGAGGGAAAFQGPAGPPGCSAPQGPRLDRPTSAPRQGGAGAARGAARDPPRDALGTRPRCSAAAGVLVARRDGDGKRRNEPIGGTAAPRRQRGLVPSRPRLGPVSAPPSQPATERRRVPAARGRRSPWARPGVAGGRVRRGPPKGPQVTRPRREGRASRLPSPRPRSRLCSARHATGHVSGLHGRPRTPRGCRHVAQPGRRPQGPGLCCAAATGSPRARPRRPGPRARD